MGYGKKLTCPPHVPTVDESREILKEYRYALLVKFRSPAVADEEIAKAPYRTWLDPSGPEEVREKAGKFWSDYFDYSKTMLNSMLELEKTAFNAGFTFAVAFVNGSCRLCEKCNVKGHLHPFKHGQNPGACRRDQYEEDGCRSRYAHNIPDQRTA